MGTHSSSIRSSSSAAIANIESGLKDLRAIVGEEHARPCGAEDSVDRTSPRLLLEPGTAEELASILKAATAAGLHVIPRGGGSKMEWGNAPSHANVIVSTRRLRRVLEHAHSDMTATVEAGCTIQQLQNTLAEHGQRLALDPLWPEKATIGGVLATNDSGSLRIRFGSLRDLIIGITLALPDGTLAKSGGKVVKNVAGYDLPKLATGSQGTLAVITQAVFRLHPLPRETRLISFSVPDHKAANSLVLSILDSTLVPSGLQLRFTSPARLEIDVRFEGTTAGCEEQRAQTLRLAAPATEIGCDPTIWKAPETLWNGTEPAVVAKFSLLPSALDTFLSQLSQISERLQLSSRIVAQGVGVGLLRFEAQDCAALLVAIHELRRQVESAAGSFSVLHCPAEIKSKIDVWGSAGDALQLMRNIKARFDPTGTLNPGRFIGGI